MSRYALAPFVAVFVLLSVAAEAQYIVIRTGENIDTVFGQQLQSGRLEIALPSGEKISIPIEYVHTEMSRAVNRIPEPRPPTAPSGGSSSSLTDIINRKCEAEYRTDFRMQAYCRDRQLDGARAMAARKMDTQDLKTIRGKCGTEWPNDFRMMNYCEEKQLEALRKLGR